MQSVRVDHAVSEHPAPQMQHAHACEQVGGERIQPSQNTVAEHALAPNRKQRRCTPTHTDSTYPGIRQKPGIPAPWHSRRNTPCNLAASRVEAAEKGAPLLLAERSLNERA
eukprot:7385181-Prymnesium_polylepis.1